MEETAMRRRRRMKKRQEGAVVKSDRDVFSSFLLMMTLMKRRLHHRGGLPLWASRASSPSQQIFKATAMKAASSSSTSSASTSSTASPIYFLTGAGGAGASRCSFAFLAMDSNRVSHSVNRFISFSWLQAITSNLSNLPTILASFSSTLSDIFLSWFFNNTKSLFVLFTFLFLFLF